MPFAALLAAVVFKDMLGWRRALGMAVAFGGVALIAGEPREHDREVQQTESHGNQEHRVPAAGGRLGEGTQEQRDQGEAQGETPGQAVLEAARKHHEKNQTFQIDARP